MITVAQAGRALSDATTVFERHDEGLERAMPVSKRLTVREPIQSRQLAYVDVRLRPPTGTVITRRLPCHTSMIRSIARSCASIVASRSVAQSTTSAGAVMCPWPSKL